MGDLILQTTAFDNIVVQFLKLILNRIEITNATTTERASWCCVHSCLLILLGTKYRCQVLGHVDGSISKLGEC